MLGSNLLSVASTKNFWRIVGVVGVVVSVFLFVSSPSWPTPDKLFIFLLFIFLALGQTWEFLKKFTPFVAMLLAYESFRGLVPKLNDRVEYQWMIDVDRQLGGGQLPTTWLQDHLWNGSIQWYDFGLYFVYMLHFVLPFALAIFIWKRYVSQYWQYVWTFVTLSFMGFFTFWAFPAAPPWLASNEGFTESITRVSSEVWWALGITDFPSLYSKISPNPVAAVPSLHAAYATLFAIFIFKLFGKKWGSLSLVYPFAIYFGTVYQGEHYLIDEILGALYAFAAFALVSAIFKKLKTHQGKSAKRRAKAKVITRSKDLGVSFSLLACNDYGIDWQPALKSTIKLGFSRFRMMSYWNMLEANEGVYDFKDLDKQLEIVKKSGGRVTLAIGMKQPRWPETHLPDWTIGLSDLDIKKKYLKFHRAVVERYKGSDVIESWQLENEFWLRSFGKHFNFSRTRLREEFAIIRQLDPDRPIIMTLAQVLSLPIRKPTPDIYGTSMYRVIYNSKKDKYTITWAKPWVYSVKRALIRIVKRRDLIVHELQAEPWGPKANWEMTTKQQFMSIDPEQVKKAVAYAEQSGITYIDMWGAEWWYWRLVKDDDKFLESTVAGLVGSDSNIA